MRKIANKLTEVKYARADRKVVHGGSMAHKIALRAFNRATRHAARLALRNGEEA